MVAGNPVLEGIDREEKVTLSSNATVLVEDHPRIDFSRILGTAKPTRVAQGVVTGFSFPVFNSDDEEIFLICDVPNWYNGSSDVTVHIHVYLDTANTSKNFNLEVAWEHYTVGTDTVPATSNSVTTETATGTASQYQSFEVEFTIDYDIDTPDNLTSEDEIALRIRRLAASGNEIAGEIVITQIGCVFQKDKLGT